MGFIDLFRPKWKHSSSYIREKAIESCLLDDQAVFAKVAKTDKAKSVRICAVERLRDIKVLVWVAKHDREEKVRYSARRRLGDAVEYLDQEKIAAIAKNGNDPYLRCVAAHRLNDTALAQKVFAEMARTSVDFDVRWSAASGLSDQNILVDLALKDPDKYIRGSATIKIADQAILGSIAKNDPASYVRERALKNLEDKTVLAEIIKNDNDRPIRLEAERRLDLLNNIKKRIDQRDAVKLELAKFPGPTDAVAKEVWNWLTRHEGRLVHVELNKVSCDRQWPAAGDWRIDLPVSLDPIVWILPISCLSESEVPFSFPIHGRNGYHEVKVSETRLEYSIGFRANWYGGKDDNDLCHDYRVMNQADVRNWETYCFQLKDVDKGANSLPAGNR